MQAQRQPQGWSQWPVVTAQAQLHVPQVPLQAAQVPHRASQGAAPFPCPLPTTLSRQHVPDRETGSFTPPPAGIVSFGRALREGTPPSAVRATSPEGPAAIVVASSHPGMACPRSPGKGRTGPGLPTGSAKTTPKPGNRQVLSFAPARTGSPARKGQGGSGIYLPGAEDDARVRGASAGRAAVSSVNVSGEGLRAARSPKPNEYRYAHLMDTGRSDEASEMRASRKSEETIPEGAAWPERGAEDLRAHLDAEVERRARDREQRERDLRSREARLAELQEKLEARERAVATREADLVCRETRVADREADLAKMFDRLTEREEHHRRENQTRHGELVSKEEGLRAQAQDVHERSADLNCRSADLDQREVKLKAEEDRCRELKRSLDERDARWHEAAKDASVVLKPHLKPRLSPRGGKENVELQKQLEEQRGLMHKIKRKQDSWAEGLEDSRGHRDSFGSEETVTGPSF